MDGDFNHPAWQQAGFLPQGRGNGQNAELNNQATETPLYHEVEGLQIPALGAEGDEFFANLNTEDYLTVGAAQPGAELAAFNTGAAQFGTGQLDNSQFTFGATQPQPQVLAPQPQFGTGQLDGNQFTYTAPAHQQYAEAPAGAFLQQLTGEPLPPAVVDQVIDPELFHAGQQQALNEVQQFNAFGQMNPIHAPAGACHAPGYVQPQDLYHAPQPQPGVYPTQPQQIMQAHNFTHQFDHIATLQQPQQAAPASQPEAYGDYVDPTTQHTIGTSGFGRPLPAPAAPAPKATKKGKAAPKAASKKATKKAPKKTSKAAPKTTTKAATKKRSSANAVASGSKAPPVAAVSAALAAEDGMKPVIRRANKKNARPPPWGDRPLTSQADLNTRVSRGELPEAELVNGELKHRELYTDDARSPYGKDIGVRRVCGECHELLPHPHSMPATEEARKKAAKKEKASVRLGLMPGTTCLLHCNKCGLMNRDTHRRRHAVMFGIERHCYWDAEDTHPLTIGAEEHIAQCAAKEQRKRVLRKERDAKRKRAKLAQKEQDAQAALDAAALLIAGIEVDPEDLDEGEYQFEEDEEGA